MEALKAAYATHREYEVKTACNWSGNSVLKENECIEDRSSICVEMIFRNGPLCTDGNAREVSNINW